jgi:carbonic anhydrase
MTDSSWEPFGATRRMAGGDGAGAPSPEAAAPPAAAPEAAAPPVAALPREPARGLVVITCMDARIDPLAVLGLRLGDAHVIRNAGATVSEDVLRSVHASHSKLGTSHALIMGHTDCAGHGSDAAAADAVSDAARRLRSLGALPEDFGIEALMYDVRTGKVSRLD